MAEGIKNKVKEKTEKVNAVGTKPEIEKDKKIEDKGAKGKKDIKKKKVKKEIPIKDVAFANGFDLKISPKQSKYTCRIIRGKTPTVAISRLQAVINERRAVPMAGLEVGHRKGKGLSGGRFPKNCCKAIMEIVKQAGANAVIAGIENPIISIAKSNQAAAPYRKAGRKAKRTHIYIEIRDKVKMMEAKHK